MPRFVERFRCIGPRCEDTCCSDWAIYVDKKTYKAYRKAAPPELDHLMENIVRLNGGSDNSPYAAIMPVGELRRCPALTDGLCSVHATLGESYLSNVCHSYPRTNRSAHGQFEQMITLSCPEAARLALLADDAFDFVEAPVQLRESEVVKVDSRFDFSPEVMTEIRIFCLNLVRTRELALWQRLALLGNFCDSLTHLCITKQQAAAPTLINDFVRVIENGDLVAALDLIQPNHEAQSQVFATLWGAKGFETGSAAQRELIRQISGKLGADDSGQVTAEGLVAAYRRGLGRLDEALAETPWWLENYLVNEMFTQFVPFNGNNPYDGFVRIVARFGLLRLLLAAQCNTGDGPPPLATLTTTVYLYCRRFQHDRDYGDRVNTALYESGWADLNKLYTLLRT